MTEPISLRERKKAETHERITTAAWELFERQGYEETTLTEIAEAASVSARTLFHYFPTKEALVYPTLDEELDRLAAAFAARPADEPVFASLLTASAELAAYRGDDPAPQELELTVLTDAGRKGRAYLEDAITQRIHRMVLERYEGNPDADLRARIAASVTGTIIAIGMEQLLADPATDMQTETERGVAILRDMTR